MGPDIPQASLALVTEDRFLEDTIQAMETALSKYDWSSTKRRARFAVAQPQRENWSDNLACGREHLVLELLSMRKPTYALAVRPACWCNAECCC